MYIDFKETIWYRVKIDNTAIDKNKLIQAVKNREINTSAELLEYLCEESGDVDSFEGEYLKDTAEPIINIDPQDNDTLSTVEMYDDNQKQIFKNGDC